MKEKRLPFMKVGIRTLTDADGAECYAPIIALPYIDKVGAEHEGVFEFEYSTTDLSIAEQMVNDIHLFLAQFVDTEAIREWSKNVN